MGALRPFPEAARAVGAALAALETEAAEEIERRTMLIASDIRVSLDAALIG
jgi:hypothetical protein